MFFSFMTLGMGWASIKILPQKSVLQKLGYYAYIYFTQFIIELLPKLLSSYPEYVSKPTQAPLPLVL